MSVVETVVVDHDTGERIEVRTPADLPAWLVDVLDPPMCVRHWAAQPPSRFTIERTTVEYESITVAEDGAITTVAERVTTATTYRPEVTS